LARIDRLEKRAAISGGTPSPAATSPAAPPPPKEHPVEPVAEATAPPVPRPEPTAAAEVPTERQPAPTQPAPTQPPTPEPTPPTASSTTAAPEGGLTLVEVRRLWPDIVEATKLRRRVAWMHLTQNSQVIGVEGNTLVLGFNNAGARDSFVNGGCDEILRQAAIDVVGADWKIDAIVDPGARPSPAAPSPTTPPAAPPAPSPPPSQEADAPAQSSAAAAARGAISQTRSGEPAEDPRARADADAHPDDPDADGGDIDTTELLQRELGAQVIEETRNQ